MTVLFFRENILLNERNLGKLRLKVFLISDKIQKKFVMFSVQILICKHFSL